MADPSRPRRAVAMTYDPKSDAAPRVVAAGKGALAERIVALARQGNVPVREDAALVGVLSRLKVGQEIPPALYRAVAAILALLHRANRPAV